MEVCDWTPSQMLELIGQRTTLVIFHHDRQPEHKDLAIDIGEWCAAQGWQLRLAWVRMDGSPLAGLLAGVTSPNAFPIVRLYAGGHVSGIPTVLPRLTDLIASDLAEWGVKT